MSRLRERVEHLRVQRRAERARERERARAASLEAKRKHSPDAANALSAADGQRLVRVVARHRVEEAALLVLAQAPKDDAAVREEEGRPNGRVEILVPKGARHII